MVSIDTGRGTLYLESAKRLISEILEQTSHDVLLSTNNYDFFSDIISERCKVRNNIKEDSILEYGTEFNFNLKHHAFIDIPEIYDYIIYIDCDIKLTSWTNDSDLFMTNEMVNYEFSADRLNAILIDDVKRFKTGTPCLFSHKISSYDIIERYSEDDDIMNSRLPSEHIFIIKNDKDKVIKFQEKWEELNNYLQSKNGLGGSWGDGFEIGISLRYAGYRNFINLSPYYWNVVLGFNFNGNKF